MADSLLKDIADDRTCRDVRVYIPQGSFRGHYEDYNGYGNPYRHWGYFPPDNFVEVDDFSTLTLGVDKVHEDTSVNVSCSSGRITVNGLTSSESYHVYDMAGAVRRSGILHDGDNTIEVIPGLYILRVGTATRKILVP